ncbi:hypothetical protein PFISCL1PPCAC_19300, partial [Pristionchus fissidentatus]
PTIGYRRMNIALLGHVDAGKTTLAKAISEVASTAAFNHAEGRENTVDLGYSSLTINDRRVVLIDCPGHAAMIRAVVAASSVIDGAVVVVSAVKGVETQTAEHLLLASLCCPARMIVVMTKEDVASKEQVESSEKSIRRAFKTLGVKLPTIMRVHLAEEKEEKRSEIIDRLRTAIEEMIEGGEELGPSSSSSLPSPLIAVDHCFSVKGKGSVLTGSVLNGEIKVGAEIEIGVTKERRKVKELQSWKEMRETITRGERVAMLVSSLQSPLSRCIVGPPGGLSPLTSVRGTVNIIPFFRFPIKDGAKVHISCGYETEMATVRFGREEEDGSFELLPVLSSPCTAFISLSRPLYSPLQSFYVASRLELQAKGCRFAFHGRLNAVENSEGTARFFSRQKREGEVERVHDRRTLIVKTLFKKETKQSLFTGMQVRLSTGSIGRLEGPFGASGKTRVALNESMKEDEKKKMEQGGVKVFLHLKKWLTDRSMTGYLPEKIEDEEEGEKEKGDSQ